MPRFLVSAETPGPRPAIIGESRRRTSVGSDVYGNTRGGTGKEKL